MKIDRTLIEKYHLGLCTEEERFGVEDWLLNDEREEELLLPEEEDKLAYKEEIWNAVISDVPSLKPAPKRIYFEYFNISRLVAASLILGILGIGLAVWKYNSTKEGTVSVINSTPDREKIDMQDITITLASQSKASVTPKDRNSGNIDFCGIIMISPKKDFELTIKEGCSSSQSNATNETIHLKKGNTYIAVNYRYNLEKELIVVNERNLINLPPILQREIMSQFNI